MRIIICDYVLLLAKGLKLCRLVTIDYVSKANTFSIIFANLYLVDSRHLISGLLDFLHVSGCTAGKNKSMGISKARELANLLVRHTHTSNLACCFCVEEGLVRIESLLFPGKRIVYKI